MARRGTFGHAPRSQPNLTATIIAIAREMQAQDDANIMDAWKNGGLYEGKPVTDSMVLGHWQERMAGLSKDDPDYDAANNTYMQLQYGIAEQKASTAYAQGKLSDQGMAQFYLDWAKKVPKDSQFYRTLQTDAAKFMSASAANGRASAANAKTDAYNAFQAETAKKFIGLSDVLTSVMTQAARDNNIIGQDQDLSDFALKGENDPGRFTDLLSMITADMKARPDQYAGLVAAIRTYDPGFDGNLTSAYFANALADRVKGYTLLQTRALKDGYAAKATAAGKEATAANTLGAEIKAFPVASAYSTARTQFDAVWKSPAATDADKAVAAAKFATAIDGFAATPGLDAAMANRLQNDARALRGDPGAANQPSFYESFLGTGSSTQGSMTAGGTVSGENAQFGADVARIDFWKQQYDANPGAYVYAPSKLDPQGNPVYDPTGNGPVSVVPTSSVSSAPGNNTIIPVPTITGGAIMQVVSEKDIVFDNPFDGSHVVVGQSMTYNQGGTTVTLYGVPRPDGTTDWTPVSPFASGVSETIKTDGIHLSVNPASLGIDNVAIAAAIDKQFGTNVSASFANGAVPADGATWTPSTAPVSATKPGTQTNTTVTWKGGQLVYSQAVTTVDATGTHVGASTGTIPFTPLTGADLTTRLWDQARIAAGPDPKIDFTQPAMAALVTSHATGAAVTDVWQNPQFQAQLQAQELAQSNGDAIALQQLASVDRGIAQNLASFGPAAPGNMSEQLAAKADRIRSIGPSLTQTQIAANAKANPSIGFGGHAITVPSLPVHQEGTSGVQGATPTLIQASSSYLANLGGLGSVQVNNPFATPTPTPTPILTPTVPVVPAPVPVATSPSMQAKLASIPTIPALTLPAPVRHVPGGGV